MLSTIFCFGVCIRRCVKNVHYYIWSYLITIESQRTHLKIVGSYAHVFTVPETLAVRLCGTCNLSIKIFYTKIRK